MVASQKLKPLANWLQVPFPWHSMKGEALKSSRHEPGDCSDWPPPSAPADVCWKKQKTFHAPYLWRHLFKMQMRHTTSNNTQPTCCFNNNLETHHYKAVSDPQADPISRALWYDFRLTMYGYSHGRRFAYSTSTDVRTNLFLWKFGREGNYNIRSLRSEILNPRSTLNHHLQYQFLVRSK